MRFVVLIVFLLASQDFTESVRIVDLQVSGHAAEGSEALLGCLFDMEGDRLYSVKWYKDGREFYRYVPNNVPNTDHFPTRGVIVDMSRSSRNVVTLVHLTRESAGVYRCEVSGEAPHFTTVHKEKHISIYLIPQEGPTITGLKDVYSIGDTVTLNCTSPPSRPDASLKWLLNGVPVPEEYVYGPWYKTTPEGDQAPFKTKLKLSFRVTPDHFSNGAMTIMCQSIIAPLYNKETHFTYHLRTQTTTEPTTVSKSGTTIAASVLITFLHYILLFLIV